MAIIHPSLRIIHSLHVRQLLALGARAAQRFLRRVRRFFHKQDRQPVTLFEFCQYTGLTVQAVCLRFGWPYWNLPAISSTLKNCQHAL